MAFQPSLMFAGKAFASEATFSFSKIWQAPDPARKDRVLEK